MDITKIRFRNYKSFSEEKYEEISFDSSINLVIGCNNSGKSSLIDIIEMAFDDYTYYQHSSGPLEMLTAFSITKDHLVFFDKNTSGGDIPGKSHQEYAFGFLGSDLWTEKKITRNRKSGGTFTLKKDLSFSSVETNNKEEELKGLEYWKRTAKTYEDYNFDVLFRRINADRDIIPEKENSNLRVDNNGNGTTNIVRHFINDSDYDETIVETVLLQELNKIVRPDSEFRSIRVQEIGDDDNRKWEIFLGESDGRRFALSQSGSGLKTIIMVLVNLFLIPKIDGNKNKSFVYAFEELENNLHPALQRRLFEYLKIFAKEHDCLIFLTSHSHVAINVLYGDSESKIYHVQKESDISTISKIESYFDKVEILNDLDVKASDLLQSNGIIWVEGPTDRIYIKRWLEVFTSNDIEEGKDYQFLYYGGRMLSNYDLGGDESIEGLISILTTNRNAAIVIDSDKRKKSERINKTKNRIKNGFESRNLMCWITQGKEIENYISARCVNETYSSHYKENVGQYDLFADYIYNIKPSFSNQKVTVAKELSKNINIEDNLLDLVKQIRRLYKEILKWNRIDE